MNLLDTTTYKDDIVNTKIKLAALWTSLMFFYIYCDYFGLMTPGAVEDLINLQTPVGEVTPGLLVIFSVILIIPAMMICLSVMLRVGVNRWLNIIVPALWSVMSFLILFAGLQDPNPWYIFYNLYQVVEIVVLGVIIYTAWNWPRVVSDVLPLNP